MPTPDYQAFKAQLIAQQGGFAMESNQIDLAAAVAPSFSSDSMDVEEEHGKRGKKRAAAEDVTTSAAKRRAGPPVVEKITKGAGAVMQFKVNPSKSVPHQIPPTAAPAKHGKIPSSLAKTAASGMMYSFNFKKDKKRTESDSTEDVQAAPYPDFPAAAFPLGAPLSAGVQPPMEGPSPSFPLRRISSIGVDLPLGPIFLTDFDQLGTLGTGTFGKVKLCVHRVTRQYFCLKILKKQIIFRYHQLNHVQNEKFVLQQIMHPGVVRLFRTFNDAENVYLLIEYAPGGELFTLIRRFGKFTEDVARFYAAEIIVVLEHLHSKNIVYRDLKPENILLDPQGHVKLADFGFAKQIFDRTWTMCGTPDYMAPELIAMSGHGMAVDYWSLGVLIFEMLVGFPPFTDPTTEGLFAKIREPNKLVFPPHISPTAHHFIMSLLVVDPSRRLGNIHKDTENIRNHPWLASVDWAKVDARSGQGPIIPPLRSAGDTRNFELNDGGPDRLPPQPDVELPPDVQKFFDGF